MAYSVILHVHVYGLYHWLFFCSCRDPITCVIQTLDSTREVPTSNRIVRSTAPTGISSQEPSVWISLQWQVSFLQSNTNPGLVNCNTHLVYVPESTHNIISLFKVQLRLYTIDCNHYKTMYRIWIVKMTKICDKLVSSSIYVKL